MLSIKLDHKSAVVGMSGGVDSSVAARLLKDDGYNVSGVFLQTWHMTSTEAHSSTEQKSIQIVQNVADSLGIPLHVVDLREDFYFRIILPFIDEYTSGLTPNPCIHCNHGIKWAALLAEADRLGSYWVTTGHYARLRQRQDGAMELLRGLDAQKDQSYFLSFLTQEQLKRTMFPVGELTKPVLRKMAREFNIPVAERPESQDLCFLDGADYRKFLKLHAPDSTRPGRIINQKGEVLGEHKGLFAYTIGQRKGLGIASSIPLYVIKKVVEENELVVGTGEELGKFVAVVNNVHWIAGRAPQVALKCQVKIRYKAPFISAMVSETNHSRVRVEFDQPIRDLTPGQVAVFYDQYIVLGGGIISMDED